MLNFSKYPNQTHLHLGQRVSQFSKKKIFEIFEKQIFLLRPVHTNINIQNENAVRFCIRFVFPDQCVKTPDVLNENAESLSDSR